MLRRLMLIFYIGAGIVFLVALWEEGQEGKGYTVPDYEKEDIVWILKKTVLDMDDYDTLYHQTGLGKPSIDIVRNQENGIECMLQYQNDFFTKQRIVCKSIFLTTRQESIQTEEGQYAFSLAPLKKGDILVTKATHFFGWRHGHTGIVIDEKEGLTLESMVVGEDSVVRSVNAWRKYPDVIILRMKEVPQEQLDEIAFYAQENLSKIPYRMSAGLFSAKYKEGATVSGTQCAHLVWYAFRHFGYDIDSDGGKIVTPKDIVESPLFEVVQIYGIDPDDLWP